MRNLKRLVAAGIPAPAPVLIKNNVLVMDFLGKGGWPAPRLRDVQLGPKKMKVYLLKEWVRVSLGLGLAEAGGRAARTQEDEGTYIHK